MSIIEHIHFLVVGVLAVYFGFIVAFYPSKGLPYKRSRIAAAVSWVARLVLFPLPTRWQDPVARVLGVGMMVFGVGSIAAVLLIWSALSDPDTTKTQRLKVLGYTKPEIANVVQQSGGDYFQGVFRSVRQWRPDLYYETDRFMTFCATDPETYCQASFDLVSSFEKGIPADAVLLDIKNTLDRKIEEEREELIRAGRYQTVIAERYAKYGSSIAQQSERSYQAFLKSPSKPYCDATLQKARDYLLVDDRNSAQNYAQDVVDVMVRYLGKKHPRVVEVRRQIESMGLSVR